MTYREDTKEEKTTLNKNFVPEKYGMVVCPLCKGKGFSVKVSEDTEIFLRRACKKCGGFGAIKKEAETDMNCQG